MCNIYCIHKHPPWVVFGVVKTDLSAQLGPACALGLLVALGQCSVAGAQSLAGSVVYLHGDALCRALLGETLHMAGLPVAQEVLEPSKKLREFPVSRSKIRRGGTS